MPGAAGKKHVSLYARWWDTVRMLRCSGRYVYVHVLCRNALSVLDVTDCAPRYALRRPRVANRKGGRLKFTSCTV
eukprot:129958-Prymnesium_polylepis.1